MDSVSQLPSPRSLSNKLLHDLQFLVATGFESAGIVKNVTAMIGEDKFILDVVLATLSKDQAQPKRCTRDTNVNGRVKSNLLTPLVNGWTVRSVAHSLQDGGLASVCTSYNEDSELDLWELTAGR
jgi:hypothetical protein